eukprot:894147-Prorocentrum_minimum.AAC.1
MPHANRTGPPPAKRTSAETGQLVMTVGPVLAQAAQGETRKPPVYPRRTKRIARRWTSLVLADPLLIRI